MPIQHREQNKKARRVANVSTKKQIFIVENVDQVYNVQGTAKVISFQIVLQDVEYQGVRKHEQFNFWKYLEFYFWFD